MLELSNVGCVLPEGRRLFAGVDMSAHQGEMIAISGPSGIGKSTLLTIIGCILRPTEGTIVCRASSDQPFAWILQGLNVLPARTVLDNVLLTSLFDGSGKINRLESALAALSAVDLEAEAGQRARVLSGGEVQRLSVARAVAGSKPIILADEPTNQLDSGNACKVMNLLQLVAIRDGRCVILVSHDLDSIPEESRHFKLTVDGLVEMKTR